MESAKSISGNITFFRLFIKSGTLISTLYLEMCFTFSRGNFGLWTLKLLSKKLLFRYLEQFIFQCSSFLLKYLRKDTEVQC